MHLLAIRWHAIRWHAITATATLVDHRESAFGSLHLAACRGCGGIGAGAAVYGSKRQGGGAPARGAAGESPRSAGGSSRSARSRRSGGGSPPQGGGVEIDERNV